MLLVRTLVTTKITRTFLYLSLVTPHYDSPLVILRFRDVVVELLVSFLSFIRFTTTSLVIYHSPFLYLISTSREKSPHISLKLLSLYSTVTSYKNYKGDRFLFNTLKFKFIDVCIEPLYQTKVWCYNFVYNVTSFR